MPIMPVLENQNNDLLIGEELKACSLNVEGISRAKCEILSKLMNEEDIKILMLHETHSKDETDIQSHGTIEGFTLISAVHSNVHGIAVYIREDIVE